MIESIRSAYDWTVISWHFGNRCSYTCSYCPARYHDGSQPHPNAVLSGHFVKQVAAHFSPPRKIWWNFSGGEPTLFPGFVTLCETIRAELPTSHICVISNASRTERWWSDAIDHIGSAILTYHVEFADLGKFSTIAALLRDRKKLERIHLPMLPDRWGECVAAYEALRSQGFKVFAKPLLIDWGETLYPYSEEQKSFIEADRTSGLRTWVTRDGAERLEPVQSLIVNEENFFQGWSCEVGSQHLVVKMDGSVVRGECAVGGEIGKLGGSIRFDGTPIICTKAHCPCVVDVTLTKRRCKSDSDLPK